MAILTYNNFDLLLHQSRESNSARARSSPTRETSPKFVPSVGEQEQATTQSPLSDMRILGVSQEEAQCP